MTSLDFSTFETKLSLSQWLGGGLHIKGNIYCIDNIINYTYMYIERISIPCIFNKVPSAFSLKAFIDLTDFSI